MRRALLAGAALGVIALPMSAIPAAAQDEPRQLEEIIVTGSRIQSSNFTSASPLQVVGAEDIDFGGAPNLQSLLLKNPTFGAPGISRTNSNFSTSSAGVATVDLRNLGADRTLVLVNGRRFVAGVPTTSQVDLNTIPAQFIERVEILTGGASAVYGSDAVAGVVNIIYKTDFEGVEGDFRYGKSWQGDGTEKEANITLGGNFGGGRGNIVAHLGYTDEGAVFSRDRDISDVDQISTAFLTGDPEDFFEASRPFFSGFAPQGRFNTAGGSFTYNAQNQLITGFSTNGSATRAPDGFNRSAFRTIAIPTERFLFASRGHYDINDNVRFVMEGTYAASQTETELEPYPLGSDDIFETGVWNIESATFTPAAGGGFTRTITRNPTVPDAIYNAAADSNGDGLRDISFTKRLSDIANRGNVADRDTFRLMIGFEGDIPALANWKYDTYFAYGQTKEAQVSSGQVNVQSFRQALDAIPDVNDIDSDGNRTEAICRDPIARDQGCVPVNIFGFNSISPEAAAYINAPGLLSTFTEQHVGGFNLTGDLFELPAGAIAVAVGGEYRYEFSRSEFDALQQAGLNAGNAIPATRGDFDVWEGYVEGIVPVLRDMPFAETLNLRGAVRVSDYSTVGTTYSWNVGGEWAPVEDIRFRVIRAQSVRAPNIGELFAPPAQTFPPGLIDPCVGIGPTGGGVVGDNCRADPGVLANIAQNGVFTLTQSDIQGVSGFDLGNPNLSEEKGKSWTAGVVITPTSIEALADFGLTIDYFNIEIEDAIVPTPRQFILDQCYGQSNDQFCDLIRRRLAFGVNSAGSLDEIDSPITNGGGLSTEGIDVTLTHTFDFGDVGLAGVLSTRLAYTHVFEGEVIPFPGEPADPFAGEIDSAKDKFTVNFIYGWEDWSVAWTTTYIGPSDLDDQFLASFDVEPGSYGIGAEWYNDVQVRYAPTDEIEVYVGADNIFDNDPPFLPTGLPGSDTGVETSASTYDAIGRFVYVGATLKF